MPQKNQTHHWQEILVACVIGIRPQGVRRAPEAFFNGFDMFELGHAYSSFPKIWFILKACSLREIQALFTFIRQLITSVLLQAKQKAKRSPFNRIPEIKYRDEFN